jgi:hypothetical protein
MLANGVAHISFVGGGLFLPARTPYDRELMIDYVAERVRSKGTIQVIVDERRWTVQRCARVRGRDCPSCGHQLNATCALAEGHDPIACMHCAFAAPTATASSVADAA